MSLIFSLLSRVPPRWRGTSGEPQDFVCGEPDPVRLERVLLDSRDERRVVILANLETAIAAE